MSERLVRKGLKVEFDPESAVLGLITSGIPPKLWARRSFFENLASIQSNDKIKARLLKRAREVDGKIVDKLT